MNCLIIVNDGPWSSGRALAAWRFARAAVANGLEVPAVFFREDGVYNARSGSAADAGTPDLATAWRAFAESTGARLLLCRSSLDRRTRGDPEPPFEPAGLAAVFERMLACDRVVSF